MRSSGEQLGRPRTAARARWAIREATVGNGAHGNRVSTQRSEFEHRPAVLLVTYRRTMQTGLSAGWHASFAGRLFVAFKAATAERPNLMRLTQGGVSGLSGSASVYCCLEAEARGLNERRGRRGARLCWCYV